MTHQSIAGRILSFGYLSVGFFFFLSGYILSIVYLRTDTPATLRAFYAARFARVYPLFFLTLAAGTPFLIAERVQRYGLNAGLRKTAITFLANVVMLQAWFPRLRGIDNPNWSLSVETVFYLIFPFIGVWLWRLKGLRLWIVAAALWIGSQTVVNLAYDRLPPDVMQLNPLLHVATFALGIMLARWQTLERARHGASPRNSTSVILALALALAACVALVFWEPRPALAKLADGLLAPLFGCIIWAFSDNRSLPAKIMSAPWLVVLGEASFALYLIHFPAYQLFSLWHLELIPALYPLYLAGCIGLSVLSLYCVEGPARKFLLRRMRARPRETMEMASDAQ